MSDYVGEVHEKNFEQRVIKSEQPVLVDFWASWCKPCQMVMPTVEAVARDYAPRAQVVKLNIDDNPSIGAQYGIKSIPTLVLFKNGKEQERIVGAAGREKISNLIEKYLG